MTKTNVMTRLERLESSNRRMKRAFYCTVGAFLLAGLMGARYYRCGESHASRFVLVDSCGNERATLGFEDGEPVLEMIGSTGTVQVKQGINKRLLNGQPKLSGELYLQSGRKQSFVRIAAAYQTSSSGLEFGGGQKRVRIKTRLPGQDPHLQFTNENGNTTAQLP